MFDKILIAHDGSEGAVRAFGTALELARRLKAELHMISVEELPRFATTVDEVVEEEETERHRFAALAVAAQAQAKLKRVKLQTRVIPGHPVPALREVVERERFDLLVIGYMGHSALYNRLIGSTTDRLVELVPCAVLVVK
jgi:nucleotide-binding universal stress UspA family protein